MWLWGFNLVMRVFIVFSILWKGEGHPLPSLLPYAIVYSSSLAVSLLN